jgi:NTE family protein
MLDRANDGPRAAAASGLVWRALQRVLLAPVLMLLAACASPGPRYPVVEAPSAVQLPRVVAADRPVIGLVLGGGAARGFAHIGVIKVLEENGIRPDIVVGTSAGAFVGAFYAAGYDSAALAALADDMKEDQLRDIVWPDRGFVKGDRLQDFVNQRLKNRSIEDLPIRYGAVVTDLHSGATAVLTRGNVGMAVRASSAIPGIFEPVDIGGREYVDGGLVSPVPVQSARDMGADVVIAVVIARRPEDTKLIASTTDVIVQALGIMVNNLSNRELRAADVVVRPATAGLASASFATRADAIEVGAAAANAVIGRLKALLARVAELKRAGAGGVSAGGQGALLLPR